MPKSRIYEIAQELNKTNKEVIEFLKEKKVEVKSHMSTLEEKDEKMVRDAFTGKNEGKEEKKEAADRPKKKSNLIQVFRPQNAQTQEGKNFRRNKPQSDRNGQDRPARGNGEGNRSGYQNRDNQNRDGQERRFNGQGRRDNQNRDGQSRDGQERRFNGQGRRDNQNRDGQSRDNQGGRRFDNRNARIITVIRDRTTVRTAETEAVASMATETDKTETIRTETIMADAALITTETV